MVAVDDACEVREGGGNEVWRLGKCRGRMLDMLGLCCNADGGACGSQGSCALRDCMFLRLTAPSTDDNSVFTNNTAGNH
jgi:hypothetical protein